MNRGFELSGSLLIKYVGAEETVVIPEGVTEIGEEAFADNDTLQELIMPDSVLKIGEGAFRNCKKLGSIAVSKALEEIEAEAFKGCKALKELALPNTVKAVGSSAFVLCSKLKKLTCDSKVFEPGSNPFYSPNCEDCKSLADQNGFIIFAGVLFRYEGEAKEVVIPEGVFRIHNQAFRWGKRGWEGNPDISGVILPKSMQYVEAVTFRGCTGLKKVEAPDGVRFGAGAFDGCCLKPDENGFIVLGKTAVAYAGDEKEVTISDGVEILGEGLFECGWRPKRITGVTLPEGLKEIGRNAFSGQDTLLQIRFPNSLERICEGAFVGCRALKEVEIPDETEIVSGAFYGCSGLTDEKGFLILRDHLFQYSGIEETVIVPETVRHIGDRAFMKSRVKKVQLPAGLQTLGAAFRDCQWLEEIEIPEGITELESYCFFGCVALKTVRLPDTLTKIGRAVFSDCTALTELQLPRSITEIGEDAFQDCATLKTVVFPRVERLSWSVCNGCTALRTVEIPEGVEVIERSAFYGCSELQAVTVPATVKTIESTAFGKCAHLQSVTIGNPDCAISQSAFLACPKLLQADGMLIVAGKLMEYVGKGGIITIPETVTEIAPDVFRESERGWSRNRREYRKSGSLREISVPGTVEIIRKKAFCNCVALEKVTLGEGVRQLEEGAFADCQALTEITLPATLEQLGAGVFVGCKKLQKIHVAPGNPYYLSENGILYSAEKRELIYCPGGKLQKSFAVPAQVETIADQAFIDCEVLLSVEIPATVKVLGDCVFVRNGWGRNARHKNIRVAVGAGSESVGQEVFDFGFDVTPLCYPQIPVNFPKEIKAQVRLCLGYCLAPEKYSEEYAAGYREYAQSHKKTLLKKAKEQKLTAVEAYFANTTEGKVQKGYAPDLSLKKPNELQKVEILEEAVLKGTLKDLEDVLRTYQRFEVTARALGLAARYRGVDFVRMLIDHGATFCFSCTSALQRKYTLEQKTVSGSYSTEYYLMLVEKKLACLKKDRAYEYTPMCGVSSMQISEEQEEKALPLKERLAVARFLADKPKTGASMDELLFWALTNCELEFADSLMEMGVDLSKTPPKYYEAYGKQPTYLEMITQGKMSVYWTSYMYALSEMEEAQVLPVLERLHKLASAAGKKPVLSKKLFESVKWNDESLLFALKNMDVSGLNQTDAMEKAVSMGLISALSLMAELGWLARPAKRENLIAYARQMQATEALAWLLDFKNRTVDLAAEAAKEEKKMLAELMEDPNSVAALKKRWSYKKQEDGTLLITKYKGSDTEITVPAKIGKSDVTAIDEWAFSPRCYPKPENQATRSAITSVILPEGLESIGEGAFAECKQLTNVSLPSTLKTIGEKAFWDCKALKEICCAKSLKTIGANAFQGCVNLERVQLAGEIKRIGAGAFRDCDKLYQGDFLILGGSLLHCRDQSPEVQIPEGVKKIGAGAFQTYGVKIAGDRRILLPSTLEIIGEEAFSKVPIAEIDVPASVRKIEDGAFAGCSKLETVHLHEGLESIGGCAFSSCGVRTLRLPKTVTGIGASAFAFSDIRDLYIPAEVTRIGQRVLGWAFRTAAIVHTPEGSYAAEYMKKHYPDLVVLHDYEES